MAIIYKKYLREKKTFAGSASIDINKILSIKKYKTNITIGLECIYKVFAKKYEQFRFKKLSSCIKTH